MKHLKQILDNEETQILNDFEAGNFKPVANEKTEMERIKSYVAAKGNKNKRVNIRMTEQDFIQAQMKAMEEGLPYQSLLASVIHKYLAGRLIERPA